MSTTLHTPVAKAVPSKAPPALIQSVDFIGVDARATRPKSYSGAVATLVALSALMVYSVVAFTNFAKEPLPIQITAKWTIADGPVKPGPLYPMKVECLATGGCELGMFYSGRTTFSANCVSASAAFVSATRSSRRSACATLSSCAPQTVPVGERFRVESGDVLVFHICFSDDPADGLFAWYNGTSPFGIAIESVAAIGGGPPSAVRVPVHVGRTLLKLVNTTDETFKPSTLGHARAEWYPTLLSPQPLQAPTGALQSSQAFMDAGWTEVFIFNRDWVGFVSTIGGAWTLMMAGAAIGHGMFWKGAQRLASKGAKVARDVQRRSVASIGATV